jgi:cystathionine beta-lyase/cystathionine gamma-synthase
MQKYKSLNLKNWIKEAGILPGLMRLSVGLEHISDIVFDIE